MSAGEPNLAAVGKCCHELRELREKQGSSADDDVLADAEAAIIAVLERLGSLPMSIGALKTTGVGREVNSRFLRAHVNAKVREKSATLAAAWKALALTSGAVEQQTSPEKTSPAQRSPAGRCPGAEQALQGRTEAAQQPPPPVRGETETSRLGTKRPDTEGKAQSPAKKGKLAPRSDGDVPSQTAELAKCFDELSSFEFKKKEQWKGVAYKKVANALRAFAGPITSGVQASTLQGVGKESAKKIDQFLETGEIERLEKYRRGEMD